ncbi:uncharacterized protein A4U43_C04F13980 [Asparagus officinalis]|uniref:Uncharacterized protein n=1 Tax=Asparagus officinalis TaxID=4686 RepID=A0A5P1F5I2_ASPOF|nr:uncharacterized protein A4U43_C04F13980 [Asparagus officinalis]
MGLGPAKLEAIFTPYEGGDGGGEIEGGGDGERIGKPEVTWTAPAAAKNTIMEPPRSKQKQQAMENGSDTTATPARQNSKMEACLKEFAQS